MARTFMFTVTLPDSMLVDNEKDLRRKMQPNWKAFQDIIIQQLLVAIRTPDENDPMVVADKLQKAARMAEKLVGE